jgi:hypothetical protein
MKTKLFFVLVMILAAYEVRGQGTLIYDQQALGSLGTTTIQGIELGESFTPTLSQVGFIQLSLNDANPGNDLGATVTVDLRSGSITGAILETAIPVTMPDGYLNPSILNNPPTFYFNTPVSVTPGTAYFFDVNVVSGDTWKIAIGPGGGAYAGGTGYANGVASSGFNLTFTEGIVSAPEPSVGGLALLGGGMFLCVRRLKFIIGSHPKRNV